MIQQGKRLFLKILNLIRNKYRVLNLIRDKYREIINIMMNGIVSGRVVSEGGVANNPPTQGVMGVETGLGGDQISGKWVNPRTGQEVWAQRLIDDGNGALIVTDKGIITMTDFSEFVQMGEETGASIAPAQPMINDNSNLMSNEDKAMISGVNMNKPKPQQPQFSLDEPLTAQINHIDTSNSYVNTTVKTESANYKMIDKLFTKFDKLDIKVDIDWGDFPKNQIESLVDIFDVPRKEIAEYIIKKYFNSESLAEKIEEMI